MEGYVKGISVYLNSSILTIGIMQTEPNIMQRRTKDYDSRNLYREYNRIVRRQKTAFKILPDTELRCLLTAIEVEHEDR